MKIYVRCTPNEHGNYATPQLQPFPSCITLDGENATAFIANMGFVFINDGVVTPNKAAMDAWREEHPEKPFPPTELEQLRADMDDLTLAVADMLGGGV